MISIKNLYLRYIREYFALADINLEIKKGQKLAFVGRNGSGKTTLIRVLACLEKPTQGQVYINQINISKINYKTDLSVGYVPVLPIYLNKKTVYENFVYILKQRKLDKEVIENKINEIVAEFKIEHLRDEKFNKLSLYEKYLVSFARLALRDLELLLVDDIFEKLDETEIESLITLLLAKFLNNKNLTSIIATSSNYIAEKLSKEKVYFKFGSLAENLDSEII